MGKKLITLLLLSTGILFQVYADTLPELQDETLPPQVQQALTKCLEDPAQNQLHDALVALYKQLNSKQQSSVKSKLESRYHQLIRQTPKKASAINELHQKLVDIASSGRECRSYILGVQQPHATDEIRAMHNGVPSQLAANKIMTDMGSDIIKIAPEVKWLKRQNLDTTGYMSLDTIIKHPLYKKILDLPYRYAFFWAHGGKGGKGGKGKVKFKDGLTQKEKDILYKEFYAFTKYLLQQYNNSGKTFMIGNWEGDWLLTAIGSDVTKDADNVAIQGMIDWFNIKAKAIDDAKKTTPHSNVNILLYCELNHVSIALDNRVKRILNSVLPYIRVDYVSISSYDIQNYSHWKTKKQRTINNRFKAKLHNYFDYIESVLPPRDIPGKRTFIGEIGFNRYDIQNFLKSSSEEVEREQALKALLCAKINLEWGMPFWLYWAVHNNEKIDNGTFRGFGIVDQTNGHKTQLYYELHKYYRWAHCFDKKLEKPAAEFRAAAIKQLQLQISQLNKK